MAESICLFLGKLFYTLRLLAGMNIAAGFLLKKRKYFAGFAWLNGIVLGLGGAFAFWNGAVQHLPFDVVRLIYGSHYIGISLMILIVAVICYRGRWNEYLFVYVLGYALECCIHGCSKFFVELELVEDSMTSPEGIVINSILFAAAYTGLYVLLKRKQKREPGMTVDDSREFRFFLMALIFLLIYLRFAILNLRSLFFMGNPYAWGLDIMLFVIPLIFLWVMFRELRVRQLNSDLDVLKLLLAEKEKQYMLTRENVDIINRKSHDLKRMVRAFRLSSEEDKDTSLKEIERAVNIYDSMVNTGSRVIDTVLSENSLYCKEQEIGLTCTIDGNILFFMQDTDVYIMFDNLLVNAREAVERLKNEKKRHMSISVKKNRQFAVIQSRNYFEGERRVVQGELQTTKEDKEYHGFGLRSIRYIAEKYGGSMTVRQENDIFVVTLMLPIPAGKTKD